MDIIMSTRDKHPYLVVFEVAAAGLVVVEELSFEAVEATALLATARGEKVKDTKTELLGIIMPLFYFTHFLQAHLWFWL